MAEKKKSASRNANSATRKTSGKKISKAERKRRKQKKMILLGVEVAAVIILIGALYVVSKLDLMHKDDTIDQPQVVDAEQAIDSDFLVSESDVKFNEINGNMEGYRNIALFGVDARNNNLGKGSRSDTIIVASINETTKDVKLLSVYRDTYLNLGNDSYSKCNAAYAYGGPKQAINMLNMNLDLNITDYVTVGWAAVADTIDLLGGVTVEVDDAEIGHLNNYQVETADSLGRSYKKLTQTGMVTLDGIQAVSYCRIRYTAGDDFKRAERQREVIQAMSDKAKEVAKTNPAKLNEIANTVFPQTATSLQLSEILELLSDIASYNIVDTAGFPFDQYRATGTVGKNGSCVIAADLETNVTEAHLFLFDDTTYTPSAELLQYSAKVKNDTGVGKKSD